MITPYAATPVVPSILISCQLYSIFTMERDTFVINSEDPLVHAFVIARRSICVFPRRSLLFLETIKNTSGTIPPTVWLIAVADAAPATPHRKTAINRASRIMLDTPETNVVQSPSCGRSAVTRKL